MTEPELATGPGRSPQALRVAARVAHESSLSEAAPAALSVRAGSEAFETWLGHQRYVRQMPWLRKVLWAHDHAGRKVLEVGYGSGLDMASLARRGAYVVGVDSEPDYARHARHLQCLGPGAIAPMRGNARSLPFPSGAFDTVYVCDLPHTEPGSGADIALIHELLRVVRPGGDLIGVTSLRREGMSLNSVPDEYAMIWLPEFEQGRAVSGRGPREFFYELWRLLLVTFPSAIVSRFSEAGAARLRRWVGWLRRPLEAPFLWAHELLDRTASWQRRSTVDRDAGLAPDLSTVAPRALVHGMPPTPGVLAMRMREAPRGLAAIGSVVVAVIGGSAALAVIRPVRALNGSARRRRRAREVRRWVAQGTDVQLAEWTDVDDYRMWRLTR